MSFNKTILANLKREVHTAYKIWSEYAADIRWLIDAEGANREEHTDVLWDIENDLLPTFSRFNERLKEIEKGEADD